MRLEKDVRIRRRLSLTPMIDVVFLLLVFFMLAARFGIEQVIPLPLAGGAGAGAGAGDDYSGPPRLVDITAEAVALNGATVPEAGLPDALSPLMTLPEDTIVLRGRDGASVQRVVDIAEALSAVGFQTLVLAE